jgi:hypothetical protein
LGSTCATSCLTRSRYFAGQFSSSAVVGCISFVVVKRRLSPYHVLRVFMRVRPAGAGPIFITALCMLLVTVKER